MNSVEQASKLQIERFTLCFLL